ncbi:MAG TPA: hypothetical protein VFN02_07695 [Ktedonobacteraceae bacterium]|nr:hypothetical protein [Ktedonobacteraceae bacterium]
MHQPEADYTKSTPTPVVLPRDFTGIEDVFVSQEGGNILDGGAVEPSDIKEVVSFSKEKVVSGGTISMRKHVTITVLAVWVAWTLIGLIVFATTANAVILFSSPAILSIPLYKVLGFYF